MESLTPAIREVLQAPGCGNNGQSIFLFGAGNGQGPNLSEMRFRCSLPVWKGPYRQTAVFLLALRHAVHQGKAACSPESPELPGVRIADAPIHERRKSRPLQVLILPCVQNLSEGFA
jgi:hypothetical protein